MTSFGPQGAYVAELIDRAKTLTSADKERFYATLNAPLIVALASTRDSMRDAAWYAARDAKRDTVFHTARITAWEAVTRDEWNSVRGAAWDAAGALVVRDLITTDQYDTLTRPWRTIIGPIHPDDPNMTKEN